MNRHIVSLAAALLAASSLTSCIEESLPMGGTVTEGQTAAAPGAFEKFVNSMTSSLSGSFLYSGSNTDANDFGYTSFFLIRDMTGNDLVPSSLSGSNWFSPWYSCGASLAPGYANCQYPWTLYYGWIKNCNTVISLGGAEPDANHKAGVGQAYALRAMFYLDLARMYSPETYAKNKEALTVPKVTEVQSSDVYNNPRMTNAQAFEFILSDLDKAEQYLADYKRDDKYTPDLSVVYGLKARAYLTMEDWANAEKYAKLAQQGYTQMGEAEYTSRTDGFNKPNESWMFATRFQSSDDNLKLNDGDSSWGSHMIIEMGDGNECGYAANYGFPVMIDRHLYETIPATDYRKKLFVNFDIENMGEADKEKALKAYSDHPDWVERVGTNAAGNGYNAGVGGLEVKFRPNNGDGSQPMATAAAVSVPLMRVEEMKLIEIEAAGMQNEAKGIQLLTEFAKTKDPDYVYGKHNEAYGNSATSAFQNEVWWQRRVELWGEGFAMFDVKRLGKGIIRSYANTNHVEGARWNETTTPQWMTFCIISTEADYNHGIVNNPTPVAPKSDSEEFIW